MSRGVNPDSDVAAAKVRIKAVTDPKAAKQARRYYNREDNLEVIIKAMLVVGVVAVFLVIFGW